MVQKADGQNYAPKGEVKRVCAENSFFVGVIGLDHGHIYGMCNGLVEAGATLSLVFDIDDDKVNAFIATFPGVKRAQNVEEILGNPQISLIASASIPNERADIGLQAMEHGKDYFTDKPPCTTMEQVKAIRECVKRTGRKYFVYYSERLHVEGTLYAQKLVEEGAIGKVVHVMGVGPHRASVSSRPEWFFDKSRYGGILVDIGCHQIEQILTFAATSDATINYSRTENFNHPQYSDFEDFGEITLTCDNGVSGYCRLDWFTPDGLGAWGDGRVTIIGTKGYIEVRKYIDVAQSAQGDWVYLVNDEGEQRIHATGKVGFPFFGQLILDCINRSETAMTQEHALRAIEIAIEAQMKATKNTTQKE